MIKNIIIAVLAGLIVVLLFKMYGLAGQATDIKENGKLRQTIDTLKYENEMMKWPYFYDHLYFKYKDRYLKIVGSNSIQCWEDGRAAYAFKFNEDNPGMAVVYTDENGLRKITFTSR